jgi:Mrp family chromosome partitioning ATPase
VFDIILIQGSNLRDFRDATLIGPAVDGTVVVVGESTVRRQVVQFAVKHLREHKTKVVGAIMPNRDYLLPKFLYESV